MIARVILAAVLAAAFGYLLGSINSSILVVRLLKHKDIREFGSGNAGLTNTLRCFGKGCAGLTLAGDLAKGVIAVLLSRYAADLLVRGEMEMYFTGYIAGMLAIIGHVFPLYYGFKGGKGVLVGVSVFLILDWRVFCILVGIFAVVLIVSRYVSLSSMIASACCPAVTFLSQYFRNAFDMPHILLHAVLTIPMAIMVIYMHRSNIERLKNGTERKFGEKKEMQQ